MTLWILLVGVHVGALVWWLMTPKDSGFWKLPIEERARCCIEAGYGSPGGPKVIGTLSDMISLEREIDRQKQESERRIVSAMQKLVHPYSRNIPSHVQCAMQFERQRQERELAMLGRSAHSRAQDQALRNIQTRGSVTAALGSLAPFLRGK